MLAPTATGAASQSAAGPFADLPGAAHSRLALCPYSLLSAAVSMNRTRFSFERFSLTPALSSPAGRGRIVGRWFDKADDDGGSVVQCAKYFGEIFQGFQLAASPNIRILAAPKLRAQAGLTFSAVGAASL